MGERIVHHFVDSLLVNDFLAVLAIYHGPAHASETKQGNLVPVHRVGAVLHLCLSVGVLAGFSASDAGNSRGTGQSSAAYLQEITSFHESSVSKWTYLPFTLIALTGLEGQRNSQAPHPMQTASSTLGTLTPRVSSSIMVMAPVGQRLAQLPHLVPFSATQRFLFMRAVPMWYCVFSSREIFMIAPEGHTSEQRVHSGRHQPFSYPMRGCMRCSRSVEGLNTLLGQADTQSWHAVHFE